MRFFNNRPDDSRQWHDYQALELIPASVRRSPRWALPLLVMLNTMTRFVIALRRTPSTHKVQVDQLESCWREPMPTVKSTATDNLPLPVPHVPMLWILDGTFDPAISPRRVQRSPADPSTHFWAINNEN